MGVGSEPVDMSFSSCSRFVHPPQGFMRLKSCAIPWPLSGAMSDLHAVFALGPKA